jgi:DNA-binding beta-propeller fold protein YncE
VGVALGDALRRVAVLGGRECMPRSLGSVYGGAVTRFLGGSVQGVVSRVIDSRGVGSLCGIAASCGGSTLLVADGRHDGSHAIHAFNASDGAQLRVVGRKGDGRLQFKQPSQVYVAPDGFVFVADTCNNRVQVLTPRLDFHGFIGAGMLYHPFGVCANADVIVVSDASLSDRVTVFNRRGGTVRRFGAFGSSDGELNEPRGLCFMSGDRQIAVADASSSRVSVYSVDGEFIRHVGVGVLRGPCGVACSSFDELVVADSRSCRVVLFTCYGDVRALTLSWQCTGVAVCGGTVMAQVYNPSSTVIFGER